MSDQGTGISEAAIKILAAIDAAGGRSKPQTLSVREIADAAGVAFRWVTLRTNALEAAGYLTITRSERRRGGAQPFQYKITRTGAAFLDRTKTDAVAPELVAAAVG